MLMIDLMNYAITHSINHYGSPLRLRRPSWNPGRDEEEEEEEEEEEDDDYIKVFQISWKSSIL